LGDEIRRAQSSVELVATHRPVTRLADFFMRMLAGGNSGLRNQMFTFAQ
jgi:hypothetical protein